MDIEVVIEIPKGGRNKYGADGGGVIWPSEPMLTTESSLN